MPSKKHEKTWRAEPHTLATIAILKAYLYAYFLILGRTKNGCTCLYIDGFAGPGEYSNSPTGSPIAALVAVKAALSQLGDNWRAGHVDCVFIEDDSERCAHLRKRVASFEGDPRLRIHVIEDSFENGMTQLREQIPEPFESDDPLFAFIDPFGATGVHFSLVSRILGSQCSEVLVNLDSDGIARILCAKEMANHEEVLDSIFGDRSWAIALTSPDFPTLCRQVLELYKSKLRAIPGVDYVFSFEMQGNKDTLNYHLVCASRHPLGLVKMKEAMRTIDQTGSYCFSDGRVGQNVLFRFDDPEQFANDLHGYFLGRDVPAAEVLAYSLNETPFTNAKGMLRVLEGRGLVEAVSLNPKRRRGDFNEDTLLSVKFLPARSSPPLQGQGGLFGKEDSN
jgi:three-Cys-motif partner protein